MKIAYICEGVMMPGGGIRIVFEHTTRLAGRGHEVFIATERHQTGQDWFPGLKARIVLPVDLPPDLDLVVADGGMTPFYVDTLGLKCPKVFFVQSPYARLFEDNKDWIAKVREVFAKEDYTLLTEGDELAAWILENYGRKAKVVLNGTNLDEMYPDPDPSLREGETRPIALVEGTPWQPYKGVADSMEALKGTGAAIWAIAANGIIEGADRFWQAPSRDKFRQLLSTVDFVVKASHVEGMPLLHMETMACGTALVTTNPIGVSQYCRHGENSLIAPIGDIAEIRRQILRLIEDPALRDRLAANGRELAARAFDWEPRIDELEAFYREVAGWNG